MGDTDDSPASDTFLRGDRTWPERPTQVGDRARHGVEVHHVKDVYVCWFCASLSISAASGDSVNLYAVGRITVNMGQPRCDMTHFQHAHSDLLVISARY